MKRVKVTFYCTIERLLKESRQLGFHFAILATKKMLENQSTIRQGRFNLINRKVD